MLTVKLLNEWSGELGYIERDFSVVQQTKRIEFLDIFKSFGIILMVMGHVGFRGSFDFFIHAFHMPMFFWISGFLFKSKSKEELSLLNYISKKAKHLLLPYFVFGIAHYLFSACVTIIGGHSVNVSPLIHLFTINTTGLPICGALWFLTSLFFTDLLFCLIDRYILNDLVKTIVVVVIALIGNTANYFIPFMLPFALGPSLVGIGLFYIGYIFKKKSNVSFISFLMNMSWIPNCALSVLSVILIFVNGPINMRMGEYSFIPLFWINAILAIIVGYNFSRLLYPHIKDCIIGKWLMQIGKNSIVYVCLNEIVIFLVSRILSCLVKLPIYFEKIIVLVTCLLILYFINKLFMGTELKKLFGK